MRATRPTARTSISNGKAGATSKRGSGRTPIGTGDIRVLALRRGNGLASALAASYDDGTNTTRVIKDAQAQTLEVKVITNASGAVDTSKGTIALALGDTQDSDGVRHDLKFREVLAPEGKVMVLASMAFTLGSGITGPYRVVAHYNTNFESNLWNGSDRGTDVIQIDKPVELRQPASETIDGVTYTYTSYDNTAQSRVASGGGNTETQVITPRYKASGNNIWAVRVEISGISDATSSKNFPWAQLFFASKSACPAARHF
jgi:hypothetical protein